MINRTIAPALKSIDHIDFIAPKKQELNTDCILYHMSEVPNETARIELYFDAGKSRGTKGIANFTNGLLLSGTKTRTAIEIQDEINGLGGFYESGVSLENSAITLYCLREYAVELVEILIDSISNVEFFEKEVKEYLAENKQKWRINMEKVSFLAQREFQQKMFPNQTAYGDVTEGEYFETTTVDDLKKFHSAHYKNGLRRVVVVGDLNDQQIKQIAGMCIPISKKTKSSYESHFANKPGEFIFDKVNALQSAIRVGRTLFNKNDEDYLDFLILQTLLGDYFGSRLMSNIREDKGYTYGIGTMLSELHNTGFFVTATEVRKEVKKETLKEIKFEFERLQNEFVDEGELDLVKNYMLGQLLKSADGPYAMMDLYMSAELHGLELNFYNRALQSIQSITPQRIQELAKMYLNWNDMTIVAFG